MEIPGFYYDERKKKYFRIESANSGLNRVTPEDVRQKEVAKSMDSYRKNERSVHLPQTLRNQEINFRTKYNLREEVIRSHLKSIRPLKSEEIEVIDSCGNDMKGVVVDAVIGSPANDKLYAVMRGDTGTAVYQIPVDDVFSVDYRTTHTKRLMNLFPKPNRVIDISYIDGAGGCDRLATLTHHFPTPTRIDTSFALTAVTADPWDDRRYQFGIDGLRQTYEFSEPIFSATHFDDLNVLGGEKQIYVFKPSQSGTIKIIRFNHRITALKTASDGKFFMAGTNRGHLSCFDIREDNDLNRRFSLSLGNRSVMNLDILSDDKSVIASSHNNSLCLSDLRMFEKPVLEYSHHRNSCSKIGFSLDESVDVLCSSGDDNIVRFWSIKTGKLLHMYSPELRPSDEAMPSSTSPIIQVCYSHSWQCLNHHFKTLVFEFCGNQMNVNINGNAKTHE